jgi:hypothetical protein
MRKFSQMCVPQTSIFFNKSAYLKSQHLGFGFKTCVFKNIRLDNVGPNGSIFTFCAKNARYLAENVGPNYFSHIGVFGLFWCFTDILVVVGVLSVFWSLWCFPGLVWSY